MTSRVPPPPPGGPGALLPPDSGRDRPLFVVAAILVFLACIAALGARGAWLQAQHWTSDLESSITIQIRPVEGRDAQLDADEAANIALTLPGIVAATAHDRAHAEALLAPWLGTGNLPADLPLPLLVEVRLDPAVVAFAARASLAARINVIDALHICGAEDRFVAGLFERRFFMLGLKAGIAGAVCAGLVAIAASLGQGPADMAFFLPHWAMDPFEPALLLLAPLLAGVTAAVSARLAVAADLRGRW